MRGRCLVQPFRTLVSSNHIGVMPSTRPVRLALDFDGTLTQSDTIDHLPSIDAKSRPPGEHRRPWEQIVDSYMQDLNNHTSHYRPSKSERDTLLKETAWLASLRSVEDASHARAEHGGWFKEVTEESIEAAAQQKVASGEVAMRKGWESLIQSVLDCSRSSSTLNRSFSVVEVISVNWSRLWVWNCLKHAARQYSGICEKYVTDPLAIYANEFSNVVSEDNSTEKGSKPGGASFKIRTSADKVALYVEKGILPDRDTSNGLRPLQIYIGDSSTDLECLVAADVGICVRDAPMRSGQSELAETFERIGITACDITTFGSADTAALFQKLQNGSSNAVDNLRAEKRVWYTKDFDEVSHWLRGLLRDIG